MFDFVRRTSAYAPWVRWDARPKIRKLINTTLVLLAGLSFAAASANAQDDVPTAGPPRFLLNPGGPVATVRTLRFTPNSQRLLAAGGDKVVFAWGLNREAADAPLKFTPNPPLHWEISRGHRGYIYCLALSSDGKMAAIGGMSARDSNGDIWIFDLAMGEMTTVLRGHAHTIAGLDFSPDGKYLASSSKDGDTRLWTVEDWKYKSLQTANPKQLTDPRPVMFLSNTQLAMAVPANDNLSSWQVGIANVGGGAVRKLSNVHQGRVTALARDGKSGRWASADRSGQVYLWDGGADQAATVLRDGRVAASLSFAPENRLFVSTMRDKTGSAVLELWNVRSQERLDQVLISTGEDTFACDVSSNGKYLATYASDDSDILVWELTDDDGKAIDKPLTNSVTTRVRGSGRKNWHVAFDKADTYRLGIGQKLTDVSAWDKPRSKLSSAFDLKTREPLDLAEHDSGWRSPDTGAGNAKVERLEQGKSVEVTLGNARATIRLDRDYQGPASSYCWLTGADGKPYALAIGTDQQCGIFIYGLPRNGTCTLLRYFRHHYGWITSLSCSTDGKYLASASVDGTIKIWSLGDLRQGGANFSQRRAWGGTLVPHDNNRLLVKELNEAGILAGRGLELGDEIIGVQYLQNNEVARANTSQEMLTALEKNPLWQTVVVSVLKKGKGATQRVLFVPAWDPLMSLFLDRQGEWATWTPQGYYDSSIEGDERFGWILNAAEVGRRPRFMRADQLRRDLERPEVLEHLLEGGSLPAALRLAGEPAGPEESREQVTLLAEFLPEVKIIRPLQDEVIEPGKKIVTQARVEFPAGVNRDGFKPSLTINGIPGGKPKEQIKGNVAIYEWESTPPNKYNVIRVSSERVVTDLDDIYAVDQVNVRAEVEPKMRKLHFIGLAASAYPGRLKLNFTVKDVEAVSQLLSENAGAHYKLETNLILTDYQITKKNVEHWIDEIQKRSDEFNEEDLLIVYLAGHGITFTAEGKYYFVPPDPLMKEEDLNEDFIRSKGISWDRLRGFAEVPCRKVFMIDTCFSRGDSIRLQVNKKAAEHLKAAVQPLRRSQALVLTGCGLGEKSYEGIEDSPIKHGLFSYVVLEGLRGYADGANNKSQTGQKRDKTVDLLELVSYVTGQVPKLVKQIDVDARQQPTASSYELGFVPLIKY